MRFAQEGENYIAQEVKCINKRISLEIISGVPITKLPALRISSVSGRVTWLGKKLDPVNTREITDYHITHPVSTFGAFNNHVFSNAFFVTDSKTATTPIGTPYEVSVERIWRKLYSINAFFLLRDVLYNQGNLYSGDVIRDSVIVDTGLCRF